MDWLSLLDEAGSDPVALLAISELAGMTVVVNGDKLVIRGPKSAAVIAERLLIHKPAIMQALVYVYTNQSKHRGSSNCVCVDSVDARKDAWGFPLFGNDRSIDWR